MRQMFINGEFTQGAAANSIDIHNPATEAVLDSVPRGTEADAAAAVEAARGAFDGWRKTVANERANILHEVATKIRAHWNEMIELLTLEEGKPWDENEEEMDWTANTFDYYAELGRHEIGRVLPPGDTSQFNFVLKEPYGVAACIVPWNYPMPLLAWKVAPALVAGNTVVIKPSELTPLSALYLVEHCMEHFPPGVVNVVTGYGAETGEPLVKHPDVSLIAFTGSLATGQRIASIAAPMMKKLHLELGGNDAFVVADDADPEVTTKAVAYAALLNCGQVCTSTERVYLPGNRASEFTEALVEHVRTLKLGPGIDRNTDIGPMIGQQYREKFEDHLTQAREAGGGCLPAAGDLPILRMVFSSSRPSLQGPIAQ